MATVTLTQSAGDQLRLRLARKQHRDVASAVYTNTDDEVVEVLEYIRGMKQYGLQPE